jgi:hypothetical protein
MFNTNLSIGRYVFEGEGDEGYVPMKKNRTATLFSLRLAAALVILNITNVKQGLMSGVSEDCIQVPPCCGILLLFRMETWRGPL